MSSNFYLHEDDWGMVELLPIENLAAREDVAKAAKQFGQEHFDGTGWTDIYVVPEAEHSLAERRIPLAELRALVGSWLPEADVVQSGYSSFVEALPNSFAFGSTSLGSGAFYGNHHDNTITTLNVKNPSGEDEAAISRFAGVLFILGERHNLMLADWWSDLVVDLRDADSVIVYLRGSVDDAQDA